VNSPPIKKKSHRFEKLSTSRSVVNPYCILVWKVKYVNCFALNFDFFFFIIDNLKILRATVD